VEYNVGIGDAKFAVPKLDYDRNKK
jgi:hypothetical protein